ncbi:hypothetical protein N9L75_05240 [Porticoccaceae bacterium]|nr:hypothetical protein [Porticoccaceae bacterium]
MTIYDQEPAIISGQKRHWDGLHNTGKALAVAESAMRHQGLTVYVTSSAQQATEQTQALQFFSQKFKLPVLSFPDWETLPYDIFSPHQDIVSARLHTLSRLPTTEIGVLVVPLATLMHRLAPTDFVASRTFNYQIDDKINRENLTDQLSRAGYNRVETVYEHGEFAFRGSLIDIFPMGVKNPFRIDLMDDEIESIRLFEPESQRTLETVQEIALLPAREFPLDKAGINQFLNNWHDTFDHNPKRSTIYRDVKDGIAPQGIEYYLSLFFTDTATLFDYLPDNLQLFMDSGIETGAQQFWQDANLRYEEYSVDPERPILKPQRLFLPVDQLLAKCKNYPRTILNSETSTSDERSNKHSIHAVPDVSVNSNISAPLTKLSEFLAQYDNDKKCLRTLFCAESSGRREVLLELLKSIEIKPTEVESWQDFLDSTAPHCITIFPIEQGLIAPSASICMITEGELFGQQVMQRRRRSKASESPDYVFKSLAELKLNAPVVHIEHGVGRYQGLVTLDVDKSKQEFLMLTYANDAKLYVPVASLHLISRFGGGDQVAAPLNHLGSDRWDKAKKKAAQQVRDTAVELLDVYSSR